MEAVINLLRQERPGRADVKLEASRYLFRERLSGLSEDLFAEEAVGLGRMALTKEIPNLDGNVARAFGRNGLPLAKRMEGLIELLAENDVENRFLTRAIEEARQAERTP